ncbi:hypothetical protein FHX48_002013 [Microbacterium halimionae]|uniref:Uncharacterized protein n=1 Tax=Microbacterium halimionae TaxID=1526413 RepID=A0A7W3JQ43_9MICO|nr:hypothetical protein [Microbacterium halimionae]MBA8816919.1 hypothetical protein [Microbacterium halimionae]NII94542.1 hypothetical protein [Microbacterium halimionae]
MRSESDHIAWVESPLQLLGAAEWGHAHRRKVPIAGRLTAQMSATADELISRGAPFGECAPYLGIPWQLLATHRHWLVGDGFSGQFRLAASVLRPRSITFLDDGANAVAYADALIGYVPYARPGVAERGLTTRVAPIARERVLALARRGTVDIFTAFELGASRIERLEDIGVTSNRHSFTFTRATARPLPLETGRVVLGSARVVDGRMPEATYLRWVAAEASVAAFTYLPHRREPEAQIAAVTALPGVRVHRAELPVEMLLAGTTHPLDVVSLASSALTTLSLVLAPSGSRIQERRMRGETVEVPA